MRDIAWKARRRLCARYRTLLSRGKPSQVVATGIAREMVGVVWAIGRSALLLLNRNADPPATQEVPGTSASMPLRIVGGGVRLG